MRHQLLKDFLTEWPYERVKEMTLDEYTNNNKSDSFCYCLEFKSRILGSIKGGSSFKFGIYKRGNTKTPITTANANTDGEYAWFKKYGETRDEAFEKVKSIILEVILCVKNEQYEKIDEIDLGFAVKWKIAFLYSDYKLFNTFNKDMLLKICEHLNLPFDKKESTISLQRKIIETRPSHEDYYEYSSKLWDVIKVDEIKAKNYWLYAPGENAKHWEEFYENGIMGLGWEELGDLEQFNSKDEIEEKLQELDKVTTSKKNGASANFDFLQSIQIGDIVIVKEGRSKLLGYGEVTSEYYYDDDREVFKKCREVDWKKKGLWAVDDHQLVIKTLTDITSYDSEIVKGKKYYQFLLDKMSDSYKSDNKILELLKYKKQIILQGPPGTGKTREAKLIAAQLLGLSTVDELSNTDQFKLIQFHPSYTYEDFVRGIVSKPNDDGDGIIYEAENKILGQFAKKALDNYNSSIKENSVNIEPITTFEAFIESIKDQLALSDTHKYNITDAVYLFSADETRFKYKGDNWVAHSVGFPFLVQFKSIKNTFHFKVLSYCSWARWSGAEPSPRTVSLFLFLKSIGLIPPKASCGLYKL